MAEAGLTLDAVTKMGAETLLTPKETAEALRLSSRTIERWRQVQLGPKASKVGPRRYAYRVADVLAFVRSESQAA